MSEKLTPPQRSVPRADGLKKGSSNTTLTTPSDNEGNVWNHGKEQTQKIFSK